ncbi:LysR family transcriptional regulator [Psychromonas arctica]|uniref:LysR family transcriptional regulator n=1 Tax=Psychromonas arctica TaxID=168275 RepID=UPI002FCF8668
MEISQLTRININLLVTLQVLLQERNASSAAIRLNLSQSTISKNLSQLRHIFGDPLFHRISHGLMPTPLAQELEPKLNLAVNAINEIFSPSEFDLKEYKGSFNLSMQESAFEFVLSKVMQRVLDEAPNMRINTWVKDNISIEQLNQGRLDFVIIPHDVGQQINLNNQLNIDELYRDELVCLVRDKNPILQKKWDQQAYLNSKHIHVKDNELGLPIFDQSLSKLGFQRNVIVQVPDFNAATSLCCHSDLVFTTTKNWANSVLKSKGVVKLNLPCPSEPVVYSLIWHQRSESNHAHSWLRAQLLSLFKT